MAQGESAHLLGQVMRMAAHLRAEGATAAAELRHAGRAVTSAAGALLLVHFLAGAVDVRTVLDGMRTGAALGQLVADHAGDEVRAGLKAKHIVAKLNRAS